MTISQRIQEHEESPLSSAGNKPLSKNPGNRSQTVWGSGRTMYDHVVVVAVDDDDNDDDDDDEYEYDDDDEV